jgi:hypothetical protein
MHARHYLNEALERKQRLLLSKLPVSVAPNAPCDVMAAAWSDSILLPGNQARNKLAAAEELKRGYARSFGQKSVDFVASSLRSQRSANNIKVKTREHGSGRTGSA